MKQSPKYTNKGFIARNDSLPKMKATCVSRLSLALLACPL